VHERLPIRRARQLFAIFAGLICGILAFVWSHPFLLDNDVNAWQNVLDARSGSSAYDILHFGLHVIIGVSICIGCGILGGCCFPLLNAGVCLGIGVSCSAFPLPVSIPCCMAACIAGFVPAPFTIVLTISMVFDLDSNQSISVLIAAMSSFTCTGGLGGLRHLAGCAWKLSREVDAAAGEPEGELEGVAAEIEESQQERPQADFEIRQEVSSAIFGSP